MKNEELKKVLCQIRKYHLTTAFQDEEEFKIWLSSLNQRQITNFLSLNINLEEIAFPNSILVDLNMLNCIDYNERIKALSKLKNGDGCWHLFDELLVPNFIKSANYYKDIEILSKADTARYGLWVLGNDDFINSPYHTEDLKLIVETHDTKKENPLDFVVFEALATIAKNRDSIKSPYHQADMKLIAQVGSDCLQLSSSYPQRSMNNLATNKVSLNDEYHLENMKILATNPIANEFLYNIMTDPNNIKGKYYRKEVEALLKAKSINTAKAIYYYIANPEENQIVDMDFQYDFGIDSINYIEYAPIVNKNRIKGNRTPNYVQNLTTINEISDKFVLHYVSLLMDSSLIHSKFFDYDLNLLKGISDFSIFMDLYRFITHETSLTNPFHKSDAELLSKIYDSKTRKLILKKITDKYSFQSPNRDFDLQYICGLELNNMDEKIARQINYFLYSTEGINARTHKESLEKLSQGIYVDSADQILDYLELLEKKIADFDSDMIQNKPVQMASKEKSKIFNLFGKNRKR